MSEKENKRGRGRPRKSPEGGQTVAIYLPIELRERLRELGGSKWIVEQIRKTIDQTTDK